MSELYHELQQLAKNARIFLSMPYVEGLSPRSLAGGEVVSGGGPGPERRHGIFRLDEAGLSVLDRGSLYADSVFEGLLVADGRVFTWREHLARLIAGTRRLGIELPYDPVELSLHLAATVRAAGLAEAERAYVRLVVTRGLGDLGIHPRRTLGSTLLIIAARLRLYPEALYESGIPLAVARAVRRPGIEVLDPNIKASNYLNNIRGLLETLAEECPETLMLTGTGCVAEATADNLFLVRREEGWEQDPGRVTLVTPVHEVCLEGITRAIVLAAARREGYRCEAASSLLPLDLVGPGREVFLTGTGAGLIPVVSVAGHPVGNGVPGGVTQRLRRHLLAAIDDPAQGLAVTASRDAVERYLRPDAPVPSLNGTSWTIEEIWR